MSAGLAALRAATAKDRGARAGPEDVRERLARIVGEEDLPSRGQGRLREVLGRDQGEPPDCELGEKRSIRERLDDVLNKPREKLEIEDEREADREVEIEREIDREIDCDPGLSH